MHIRSLPHFSHKPIGKTTHKKGMSYSHVNYITRDDACSKTLAGNMPNDRDGARPYFEREANKEGVAANARIADTFIIALPIELSREQRHEAIERFMYKIGQGRIAWIAAFHDKGKDEHNPHCHLILRDADIETGRKVLGTTTSSKDVKEAKERGWKVPPRMTTKDLRKAWCGHLNSEMERHGIDVRFDERKLKERGIDRKPEIHVGPKAHSMAERDKEFFSQDRRRGDHTNVYSLLDEGSRAEHNERIREANRKRELNGKGGSQQVSVNSREGIEKKELRERQAAERKAMYADQALDRKALRAAHDAKKLEHQRWARKLYADAREKAFQDVKAKNAEAWATIHKMKQGDERDKAATALKETQKQIYARVAAKQIEQARPIKNEAWQQLKATQESERRQMKAHHNREAATLSRQHIAERNALHQKWNDYHQQKQANRTEAKLSAHQDMSTVQMNALKTIKQKVRQRRWQSASGIPASASAIEASRRLSERAKVEANARFNIRHGLNSARRANDNIAWARGGRSAERSKDIVARRQSQEQSDKRHGLQQAAATGRAVSSADIANASPNVKATIGRSAKSNRSRDNARALDRIVEQQKTDKSRDGGGRSGR